MSAFLLSGIFTLNQNPTKVFAEDNHLHNVIEGGAGVLEHEEKYVSFLPFASLVNSKEIEKVQNADEFPYNANALLILTRTDGSVLTGSGTYIAPNLILTAAHNIYGKDSETGKVQQVTASIDVVRGKNNPLHAEGNESHQVIQMKKDSTFFYRGNVDDFITVSNNDWIIIKTDSPVETQYYKSSYLNVKEDNTYNPIGKKIKTAGYPVGQVKDIDKRSHYPSGYMYKNDGIVYGIVGKEVLKSNNPYKDYFVANNENEHVVNMIGFDFASYSGSSGSSLLDEESNEVIGVLVGWRGSDSNNQSSTGINFGVFLSPEDKNYISDLIGKNKINGWITKSDGRKFYYEDNKIVKNSERVIESHKYKFDENGVASDLGEVKFSSINIIYVDEQQNELYHQTSNKKVVGEKFTIKADTKFENLYHLISDPEYTGTIKEGENVVKFVYARDDAILKFKYINGEDNSTIKEESQSVHIGDEIKVTPKHLDNFQLVDSNEKIINVDSSTKVVEIKYMPIKNDKNTNQTTNPNADVNSKPVINDKNTSSSKHEVNNNSKENGTVVNKQTENKTTSNKPSENKSGVSNSEIANNYNMDIEHPIIVNKSTDKSALSNKVTQLEIINSDVKPNVEVKKNEDSNITLNDEIKNTKQTKVNDNVKSQDIERDNQNKPEIEKIENRNGSHKVLPNTTNRPWTTTLTIAIATYTIAGLIGVVFAYTRRKKHK